MQVPLYQIDAFAIADRPFSGNPAAVCPLENWLADELMQSIAAENNLAETAFFVPEDDAYSLRWFTPTTEVDLCGHATLASGFVVLRYLDPKAERAVFRTRHAGELAVSRCGDLLSLDFPAWPAETCAMPEELAGALGAAPREVLAARDYLAVFDNAEQVATLAPDFPAIARLGRSVIVTAPGNGAVDFVSRFFAPLFGIDEDPVTGSTHCTLIPYWAARFGKTQLEARQVSARGGALRCGMHGERVTIAGQAVLYLEGKIVL